MATNYPTWYLSTDTSTGQSNFMASLPPKRLSILLLVFMVGDHAMGYCGRHDPSTNEEMEKTVTDLVAEELRLRAEVTKDHMQHTQAAIQEAKKTSSQYQREAEKCNAGMETCEEAREKAEAALRAELKLSIMWESRARELGWTDR
ncbi:hypothetical protein ACLOJK_018641 [Asimina triloba]